ncbi:hypothetical protein EMCG_09761 [[Emmonsia] crescens]|uniref:Aminoglycoside phosphotransferase domain-containing protein n=1 Tax=[Emmonsia] crescens TaxID=73230 RepID=A0A0G2I1L4_9EURO|nr:hypothetical protein EMCG_09761 [Emmonsia crescens UAMH 3008]
MPTFLLSRYNLARAKTRRAIFPQAAKMTTGSDHGFFEYTRDRFVIDEAEQMARRRIRFNINELGRVAAKAVGAMRCVNIEKCADGMYNKAYTLTMDNGMQVIGKVPNPNAGMPHYTTASEVATMEFVRNILKTPAPRVYTWSSRVDDASNTVGVEFIIMEKLLGIPLSVVWSKLNLDARFKIFIQMFDIQKKWSAVRFTQFGSLYYAKDMESCSDSPLYVEDGVPVTNDLFAVGPAAGREWNDERRQKLQCHRGPWSSVLEYRKGIALREISAIKNLSYIPKQMAMIYGPGQLYQPTLAKKLASLESYMQILKYLLPTDPSLTSGHIWHDDLHHENVFMNPDNPTEILGILDWQSVQIVPLFDHSLDPSFLGYCGLEIDDDLDIPKFPDNFNSLQGEEKTRVFNRVNDKAIMVAWRRLVQGKNPDQYKAIKFQKTTPGHILILSRRIFELAEAHLHALLLVLRDEWHDHFPEESNNSTPFPIDFSAEKVAEIEADTKRADLSIETINLMKQCFGDMWPENGVIEHEMYEEVKVALRKVKAELIEKYCGQSDQNKAIFEELWPFDD